MNVMNLSGKKLQVWHFPQFPCEPFKVDVRDEHEAIKMIKTLSDQHVWLYQNNIIPDYANAFNVVMWEDGEWAEYWNEVEQMDWDEFEAVYENELTDS